MFGIGLMELAVIAVLAVLVMGPDKIPGLAKQAAGLMKSAKNATNSVRDELRTNLGPDYADLELTDLNPRSLVRKHVMEAWNDDHDDDRIDDRYDEREAEEDLIHLDDPDDLDELDEDDAESSDDRSTTNELIERNVS
ncbi:sec-independent translocase [Nocardioides currus]|uniref:Translocase n=1 Tax=Nocardioides currus TaxID=2133958 RepID=A0A2R7Z1I6_9ACTN|nr:sec-independent translocase [Nocardioides currus]PUA82488.1 translocase [Nocardioides currus]